MFMCKPLSALGLSRQWSGDIPSDWIYPIKYNETRSYMVETARVVYDHAGFVLCGSEMPLIELRRDKSLTNQGITCYMFLFFQPLKKPKHWTSKSKH